MRETRKIMLKKTIIVLTVLLVGLLAISAVSAETDTLGDIAGTDSPTDTVESADEAVLDSSAPEELQNDEKGNDINKQLPDTDSNKLEMGESEILGKDINVTGNSFRDIENAISQADNGDFLYLQGKYYKGYDPIVIDKNITIIGGSKGDEGIYATLDAQKLDGIFVINSTVTLQGIKFTCGHSTDGGAIYVNGGCTLIDCIFKDNYASGCGGAVYWNTNAVGIINCTFEDNNAWVQGGANYFNSPVNNVDLTGDFIHNSAKFGGANYFYSAVTNSNLSCNFIRNSAREDGGANYFLGVMTNVTFTGNFTGNRGEDESGANHFYGELTNVTLAGNFTENTASLFGGANRFNNILTNVVLTANFFGNSAKYGGANYFSVAITNSIITGNFSDNYAPGTGGANYFGQTFNVNLTGNFIHNTAGQNGGANHFNSANNVILAGNFINNSAVLFGGANRFSKASTDVVLTGDFIDNSGEYGGANFFEGAAINVNLTGIFNNNTAEKSGGANYFDGEVNNVNITGRFINNIAGWDGGANYFDESLTNVTLTGNFTNNHAETHGGANYFNEPATNVTLTGNFTNNRADAHGGANYFNAAVTDVTLTGNFTNNHADGAGGANFFGELTNVNLTCNFINNTADDYGGANSFWYAVTNVTLTGNFNSNSANISGGANYFDESVTNVTLTGNFINNTADECGSANHFDWRVTNVTLTGKYINNTKSSVIFIKKSVSGNVIRDSIFLNNGPINVTEGNITAVDNWFGNNATDYNVEPDAGIDLDNWLFLNGTADPNPVLDEDTSNIVFKLSRYDGEVVSSYDNSRLIPINLTVTSTRGSVNKNKTGLDESITYMPDSAGRGSVTATVENVFCTVEFGNPNLSVGSQETTYGESVILTVSYNAIATGKVNITLKGKNMNYTFEKELNATIVLGNIDADEYEVNVIYSGDNVFLNATATGTLKVNRLKTELTASAVTATYNINKDLVITLKDANGNVLSGVNVIVDLNGAKTYTTDNNGQIKVSTKGLAPKAYTAKVIFNGNTNYAKSTKDVKVNSNPVSKPKSTLLS